MKNLTKLVAVMFVGVGASSVYAIDNNSPDVKEPVLEISFDLKDKTVHSTSKTLEDGTIAEIKVEPVDPYSRALNGTWKISGTNGLASMEYYVVLSPSGKYTTVSGTYGLAITGRLTSFDNETIRVVNKTETARRGAIVEGYAKFNYLGNQWVSVWTQSGGVRTTIKNDKFTTVLY